MNRGVTGQCDIRTMRQEGCAMKQTLMILTMGVVLLLASCSTTNNGPAPQELRSLEQVVNVDGASASALFATSRLWAARNLIPDTTTVDGDNLRIIGQYAQVITRGDRRKVVYTWVTVEVREGRARIVFDQPSFEERTVTGPVLSVSAQFGPGPQRPPFFGPNFAVANSTPPVISVRTGDVTDMRTITTIRNTWMSMADDFAGVLKNQTTEETW